VAVANGIEEADAPPDDAGACERLFHDEISPDAGRSVGLIFLSGVGTLGGRLSLRGAA